MLFPVDTKHHLTHQIFGSIRLETEMDQTKVLQLERNGRKKSPKPIGTRQGVPSQLKRLQKAVQKAKSIGATLSRSVSSLCRVHANLLCIVLS